MSTSLSELGLQLAHTECALCMLSVSEFICTLVLVSIEGLLFLVSPFPLALTALMPPLLPGYLTHDGRELMKRISYIALRVPRSPTLWTLSSCGNIIPVCCRSRLLWWWPNKTLMRRADLSGRMVMEEPWQPAVHLLRALPRPLFLCPELTPWGFCFSSAADERAEWFSVQSLDTWAFE